MAISSQELPSETQQFLHKLHLKHKLAEQYHLSQFGNVGRIISCIFNGKRHVAIGGSLVVSDDPNRDWATPSEFLISYLKTLLGKEWFDKEYCKTEGSRHLIVQWSIDAKSTIHDPENPIESLQLNGAAFSLLHLAYDLFVIENHGCLKDKEIADRLIHELKLMPNFNGARYEVYVFATLIRAGFKVEPLNQSSGKRRVAECTATHMQTGTVFQVEAKTRNVRGVFGAVAGKHKNLNLYKNLLKDAIEKDIDMPYIIFVDTNLPNLDVIQDSDKRNKISAEYEKLEMYYPDKLPNLVCFTNIPFHYDKGDLLKKKSAFGFRIPELPRIKLSNIQLIFNAISIALQQHGRLPSSFNEAEDFADQQIDKNYIPNN